jgi:hypothetical protein
MPEAATPNQAEREFETGTDESFKNANATGGAAHNENQRVTYANIKRTYDVYQDLDVQAARQSLIETTRLNQIASQALQNAVETANMVGKQAIRHADVAADALWTDELNPVTRGAGSNITAGSVPANRAIDVSAAGVGVDAQAVAAAVSERHRSVPVAPPAHRRSATRSRSTPSCSGALSSRLPLSRQAVRPRFRLGPLPVPAPRASWRPLARRPSGRTRWWYLLPSRRRSR